MIYVLIPARDEASTVGLLLWKVRQAFTGFSREYQIIVVNDGSRDASDEVLAPYTRALPLTLLNHREPRGYARSLEELLRAAVQRTDRPRRDMAVTLQADFSDSPEDLVELVKRLEAGADIAVPDRRENTFPTRTGRWAHRALNALIRRPLGLGAVPDLIGTMRAYRLAVIERLIRQHGSQPFITGDRWSADVTLLTRAARHARTIESVPVSNGRPQSARPSRARPLAAAWSAYRHAATLRAELRAPLPPPQAIVTNPELAAVATEPLASQRRAERRDESRGESRGNRQRQRGRSQDQQQQQHPQQQRGPRKQRERQKQRENPPRQQDEARAPDEAVTEPAAELAEPVMAAAGEGASPAAPRRKRRRRGRGRGRGGRQGNAGTGENGGSPPDNGTDPGDSSLSSPSAA